MCPECFVAIEELLGVGSLWQAFSFEFLESKGASEGFTLCVGELVEDHKGVQGFGTQGEARARQGHEEMGGGVGFGFRFEAQPQGGPLVFFAGVTVDIDEKYGAIALERGCCVGEFFGIDGAIEGHEDRGIGAKARGLGGECLFESFDEGVLLWVGKVHDTEIPVILEAVEYGEGGLKKAALLLEGETYLHAGYGGDGGFGLGRLGTG